MCFGSPNAFMLSNTLDVAAVTDDRATTAARNWEGLMARTERALEEVEGSKGWNCGQAGCWRREKRVLQREDRWSARWWCEVELRLEGPLGSCQHKLERVKKRDADSLPRRGKRATGKGGKEMGRERGS